MVSDKIMSEEKCTKCGKLKTECKCTNTDNKDKDITVTIDTSNIQAVLKRMAEIEAENKRLQDEAKQAAEEKVNLAKTAEEKAKEKEKLEADLKKINDDKIAEETKTLLDKAKTLITDPTKFKEFEDKAKNSENLNGLKYSIDILNTTVEEGKKQHEELIKKEREEFEKKLKENQSGSGGSVGMSSNQASQEGTNTGSIAGQQVYEGASIKEAHANMIRDLRIKSHDPNPEKAVKARAELDAMLAQWGNSAKRNYDGQAIGGLGEIGPKDIKEQPSLRQITKKGGEVA